MKNYNNVDYLKSLLENPQEFKKQSILSYGEVIQEMFNNNIIPPLKLLASDEARTAVGITIAKVFSNKYPSNDFKKFISFVKKNEKNKEDKIKNASHFLDEVKPLFTSFLPVEENINITISTVKEFFKYMLELKNIYEDSANYSSLIERRKKISNAFEILNNDKISKLEDINDSNILKLVESNTDLINIFIKNYESEYKKINANNIIYRIIENNDFKNIPDSIKKFLPIDLFLRKAIKSDENIAFLKEAIILKVNDNSNKNLFDTSLDVEEINSLAILKLDNSNDVDKKITMALISYADKEIYSADIFRKFINNSILVKTIPRSELNNIFANANEAGSDFKGDEIWSEKSLNSIVKIAEFKKMNSFSITNFYNYLNSGRSYRDDFMKTIKIPIDFMEKLHKKMESKGIRFLSDSKYDQNNEIHESRESFQIQVLKYMSSNYPKKINESDIILTEKIESYKSLLKSMSLNFSSLTSKDTLLYSDDNNDPERLKVLLDAIRLENDIYEISKTYFKISKDNFTYENIKNFEDVYRSGNEELSSSIISALAQEIVNPNMLWVLPKISENTNLYSYSHRNIHKLLDAGMPLEESLKSIFEFPLIDKDIIKNNIDKLDGYSAYRNRLVIHGISTDTIYKNMVLQLMNRERLVGMSDSDFNIHLNSVKDFIVKNKNYFNLEDKNENLIKKIENQQKALGFKNKKNPVFSDKYIFSLEFLHSNFSLDLLYKHLLYDKDTLSKWYDLKKDSISFDAINILIKEVFDIFYDENSYLRKDLPTKSLLSGSEDFLFNLISKNVSHFEESKKMLITGPHGPKYEKIFIKQNRDIIKELISNNNKSELEKILAETPFEQIKKNMGNMLASKNLDLINVLFYKIPNNNFELLFNTCAYQEQRNILIDESLLSKFFKSYSSGDKIKFNPSTFEEFKEVFEIVRKLSRKIFFTSNHYHENTSNYYDMKKKWEFSELLSYINIPELDDSINYLINELPLSFIDCYSMSVKDSSSCSNILPRALEVNEFINLLKNINKHSPGLMYIGHDSNDRNEVYRCLEQPQISRHKDLKVIDRNLDVYLKVLEQLKSNPKEYANMFCNTQSFVGDSLSNLIDGKIVDKNNLRSSKVYNWVNIPEKCLLLKELKCIFESKYDFINNINNKEDKKEFICREEYVHKFFNIFIDKTIYLQGINLIKEEILLNTEMSKKSIEYFNLNFARPYFYEVNNKNIYQMDYSTEEFNKITSEIIDIDSSLFFSRDLPKTRILRSNELNKIMLEEPKKNNNNILKENEEKLRINTLFTLTDENLSIDNIWPIIFSVNYSHNYSLTIEEEQDFFNNILNKPDLNIDMLNKISQIVDFQMELKNETVFSYMDNSMLEKLSNSLLSSFSSLELKETKIIIESLIMQKEIEIHSSNSKRKKVNKF